MFVLHEHQELIRLKNRKFKVNGKSLFFLNTLKFKHILNPISNGIFKYQVPWGWGGFHPHYRKPPRDCFFRFFFIPAKLIYNCRSHARGHSQKFKIEGIEELWNSRRKSRKKIRSQRKAHHSDILNSILLQTSSFY